MDIVPIPAFRDNYIWLLQQGRNAAVVDPGDAAPVRSYLDRHRLKLSAILVTHHHGDHAGGIEALVRDAPVPVFGPARENIPGVTVRLAEPRTVRITELGLELAVLDVPGHTRGHIAYYRANLLFCGDTLFACGCGRLFEGSAEQMWTSLAKLAALPGATRVYCAHEYTRANIEFALAVEPHNTALQARARQVDTLREQGLPTVPSTIAEELATNPFLRVAEPAVQAAASRFRGHALASAVEVFAAVREWKNRF